MKNRVRFGTLLLAATLAFSFCKKDKDDDGPCGLIGAWKFTDTDPNDPGYSYTATLTFTESTATIHEIEIVDGDSDEFTDTAPYTTNSDCSILSIDGDDISFTVDGNNLTIDGDVYLKQ